MSDFTIIRLGGNLINKLDRSDDVLANSGTRIGGNDFDRCLALSEFMPEFGKGTTYGGHTVYDPVLTVPVGHFHDLSDWGRINTPYTYKNINNVKKCLWQAHDKKRYGRLLEVMEKQLGHKVLSSVEKTKIFLTDNDIANITVANECVLMDNQQYLNKIVNVKRDRPLGTKHPKHGWEYPVNYGYIPGTVSGNGEELDAYVLGPDVPLDGFTGRCIAIIHRTNDNDDKLVVAPDGLDIDNETIEQKTKFQEQWFEHVIIREPK